MIVREAKADLPADHVHGPVYLEFDEGVEHFAKQLAALVPSTAKVAVDELTGAMRRSQTTLFPACPPRDAGAILADAKVIKTPDEVERVTGVPGAQLERVAKLFATEKPATLIWCRSLWPR